MIMDTSRLIPGIARFRLPSDIEAEVSPELAEHAARCASAMVSHARAHGLLVTKSSVPTLARSAERVAETLGMERMPEVYVVSDPGVNAKAIWAADEGRSFIEVHSGLLRICRGTELDFVLGHELAHIAFGHSARREPAGESSGADQVAVMRHRRSERAAELSCDRIGLLVSRSVASASRVMMKVASGLDDALLGTDSGSMLQQFEAEQAVGWGMRATHPALPFRLWALWETSRAVDFDGAIPLTDINIAIEARLDEETGDELRAAEQLSRSRCLFWLGIVAIHGSPSPECVRAMRERFGIDEVERGLRFAASFPQQSVRAKLMEHLSIVVGGDLSHREWVLTEISKILAVGSTGFTEPGLLREATHLLKAGARNAAR